MKFSYNNGAVPLIYESRSIDCLAAQRLVTEALVHASQAGLSVCITVVDVEGNPKAFARMDGAPFIAIESSRAKANVSLMGVPSGDLAKRMNRNTAGVVSLTAFKRQTLMAGGLPIVVQGEVVGGLGVGGATPEQDVRIAQKALAALNSAE